MNKLNCAYVIRRWSFVNDIKPLVSFFFFVYFTADYARCFINPPRLLGFFLTHKFKKNLGTIIYTSGVC